jgi:hypothetical protein
MIRAAGSRKRGAAALLPPATLLVLLVPLAISLGACAHRRGAAELSSSAARELPEAVLSWQARNERGVYGYLVFRADKAEGPFLRASKDIIHVVDDDSGNSGDPDRAEGSDVRSYTYVDRDVESGRTYYYTLDIVQNSGQKRRFSGVVSKTVDR